MTILVLLYILCIFGIAEGDDDHGILDLFRPDLSLCVILDCHVDSIPTRLYIPKDCRIIKSLVVDGRNKLWSGDHCPLVLIHYIDERPAFLRLFTELSYEIANNLYQNTDNGWKWIDSNSSMTILKDTVKTRIGLLVDINFLPKGIKEITVKWCGLDARILIPERLHYASEVCFVNEPIWRGGNDEKCVLMIICMEYGLPITVHLIVNNGYNSMTNLYFVREGLFKECTRAEYYNKLVALRKDACKSIDWAGCV